MKIGVVLECGPMGAEKKVHPLLAKRIRPDLAIETATLDNKPKLLAGCGLAAKNLLRTCDRVLIIWDLYPAWREKKERPCRKADREAAFASLDAAGVDRNDIALVCIHEELEAWLIADERAVEAVLSHFTRPHPLPQRIPRNRRPEAVVNPKKLLTRWFKAATGRAYLDRDHAHLIAAAMPDLSRLSRLPTFHRFAAKLR
jgi:hypothetical protein